MIRILSACLVSVTLLLSGCDAGHTVIERIDDAAHARVGVMTGTTGEAIAMERLPEADIKSFDDIMDAVAALKSGQLDALITGYPAAVHVAGKNPELRMLDEPLSHEDTAIALRREDTALQAKLDALIVELKQDGTLEDMKRRWFKTTPGLTKNRISPCRRLAKCCVSVSARRASRSISLISMAVSPAMTASSPA